MTASTETENNTMRYLIEVYEDGANRTDCVIYFADLSVAAVALESFRMNTSDDWEIIIGALTDTDTYNTFHPAEYEWMESEQAFTELAQLTLHIENELAKENNTI